MGKHKQKISIYLFGPDIELAKHVAREEGLSVSGLMRNLLKRRARELRI